MGVRVFPRSIGASGNGSARSTKAVSLAVAASSAVLLSSLAFLFLKNLDDLALLAAQNDTERAFSSLWESLRDHEDFGEGVESIEDLKERVIGIGIYARNGRRIFGWGGSPEAFYAEDAEGVEERAGRGYLQRPERNSLILLLRPMRMAPPSPPGEPRMPGMMRDRNGNRPAFFETFRRGSIVFLELRQEAFWRGRRLRIALFPLLAALFTGGVFFVRRVFLRNAEYRKRIEEQENLVVLGTAASTLAHEIKTPLHSIRLQTGILEKTVSGVAEREIRIINEEVERLSQLSYRVNDFIREPLGNPVPVDPAEIARETGLRAFGRDIVDAADGKIRVLIDPERLRSVMDNLLRNAAESGSPESEIRVAVTGDGKKAVIEVLDRGSGIPAENLARMFSAFFTTKSRGSGIGLQICRRFVESAGGRLSLEPRQGGGTIARIVLPEVQQ